MSKNTSISLGSYFDIFIQDQLHSGRYKNVSEIIRTALRLLEQEENKAIFFQKAIEEGMESGVDKNFDPKLHLQKLKDDNNYLNLASDILGGKIEFNNLRDRLVMEMVLLYQGYDKEIDDSAKNEILEKATKESNKHVPIIPLNN